MTPCWELLEAGGVWSQLRVPDTQHPVDRWRQLLGPPTSFCHTSGWHLPQRAVWWKKVRNGGLGLEGPALNPALTLAAMSLVPAKEGRNSTYLPGQL